MYAGTTGAGVFQSGDGGLSWRPLNSGLINMYVTSLAIDPAGTLFAGTQGNGVFGIQPVRTATITVTSTSDVSKVNHAWCSARLLPSHCAPTRRGRLPAVNPHG